MSGRFQKPTRLQIETIEVLATKLGLDPDGLAEIEDRHKLYWPNNHHKVDSAGAADMIAELYRRLDDLAAKA